MVDTLCSGLFSKKSGYSVKKPFYYSATYPYLLEGPLPDGLRVAFDLVEQWTSKPFVRQRSGITFEFVDTVACGSLGDYLGCAESGGDGEYRIQLLDSLEGAILTETAIHEILHIIFQAEHSTRGVMTSEGNAAELAFYGEVYGLYSDRRFEPGMTADQVRGLLCTIRLTTCLGEDGR